MRRAPLLASLLAWIGSAGSACDHAAVPAARSATAPQAVARRSRDAPSAPSADSSAVVADLGPQTQQFLVHAASGAIELRSYSSNGSRALVPHADAALYDATLELIWFLYEGTLSVLDLRAPESAPTVIATGIPDVVSRFSIARSGDLAETEDDCDLDAISLEWSESPTISLAFANAPKLRIDNTAWLRAQFNRKARDAGTRREFSEHRIALPSKLLHCEEKEFCGTTVGFGTQGLELVRLIDKSGGDCMHRGCVLRDARTRLFATPPQADQWGPAETTKPGPCGLFMFDQSQTRFLVADSRCSSGEGCRDLGGGHAMGWLVPGDTVGAPGIDDAEAADP
jgi:hypothetical protein